MGRESHRRGPAASEKASKGMPQQGCHSRGPTAGVPQQGSQWVGGRGQAGCAQALRGHHVAILVVAVRLPHAVSHARPWRVYHGGSNMKRGAGARWRGSDGRAPMGGLRWRASHGGLRGGPPMEGSCGVGPMEGAPTGSGGSDAQRGRGAAPAPSRRLLGLPSSVLRGLPVGPLSPIGSPNGEGDFGAHAGSPCPLRWGP